MGGVLEGVRLLALNNQSALGDWNDDWLSAEVLPGEYDVTVRYEREVASLIGLLLNLDRKTTPHTLRFSVHAGKEYVIYNELQSETYRVSERLITGAVPPWDPPQGTPACERRDAGLSICPTSP
jgi:hypothetical protein